MATVSAKRQPHAPHRGGPLPSLRRTDLGLGVLLLVGALGLAGCEDAGLTPPVDPPSVAGDWSGTATLSGQAFAASFTFTQSGVVVGGTARIDQLFGPTSIEAAIDRAGTVVILMEPGCEVWLAQMTVSGNEQSMSGPISVDRSGCPQGVGDAGSLSLTRS